MSDGKKILDDLENGKLPDIKTNSDKKSKDLIWVRYSRPVDGNVEAPMPKANRNYSAFSANKKKKQGQKSGGGVATKERKTEKFGKQ